MARPQLLPLIHSRVRARLSSWLEVPHITTPIDTYIVSPPLVNRAGIMAVFALAHQAIQ